MSLCPWTTQQWFDDVGNPLQFGKIYFYQAGTLIPKTTYKKADQSEANEHPIVLDAAGRAKVWLIDGEAYDEVDHDENDNVLRSVQGIIINGGGGGGGGDDHLVIVDSTDPTPGTLIDKTRGGDSITITVVESSGRRIQFDVNEDWLASWLLINYPFPADDHLVISDDTAQTAGTLVQKVTDAAGTVFAVNGFKQLVIPLQSYLSLIGGGTVTGPTTFTNIAFPDQFKIKANGGDLAGYYVDKIKAGAGMIFNITVDEVNGSVLHISSVEDPGVTAPLDEVISGDGAGGIKSSPLFKASGGAVAAETFRANSTAVAITAPNGSIEAKGVASVDQSTWGGAGFAFFGLKDHNPPTNDGTISGLMVGEYTAALYTNNGGSASLGTGISRLAVYGAQAAIDVPFHGPAFHPTDAVVLVGSTYTSAFHAVIAFFGTGTAFVAPAGNSINTTMRLSNSSAASISVTGTATAFTLAPGASRDLIWTADSITPTVDKWY